MMRSRMALAAAVVVCVGCGSSTPPPEAPKQDTSGDDDASAHGPAVTAEIGAMSEEKVQEAFQHVSDSLGRCFQKGAEKVPYLGGEVRFVVRVKSDGSARTAWVKETTLGDRATEECMLDILKSKTWPKPVGGNEGIAENSFTFDPDSETRQPVAWTPKHMGRSFEHAREAIVKCKRESGTKALQATLYVETDGKAKAIGVGAPDEKGAAAVPCVTSALEAMTFPSPGSYAAKVTIASD